MSRFVNTIAAAAVAFTLATPVMAQSQRGLVNVNVSDIETGDILSDITVNIGAGLNVAANVCGVAVGVLATQLGQTGVAECQTATQRVVITRLTGAD